MNGARHNRSLLAATCVLAALATLALELARQGHALQPQIGWLSTIVTLAFASAVGAWLAKQRPDNGRAAAAVVLLTGLLIVAPFVTEAICRQMWYVGESPEIVQLVALRNFMLGLMAAAIWPGVLRFCCVLSLFVTLGALMFMLSWPGYLAIALYGVVGIWWLMGANWERLHGRFPAQTRREVPLVVGSGSALLVIVAVIIAALLWGGSHSTIALGGWFHGSGGAGEADPFAARGIGDGDHLVAAKDRAASFGAVESELFLDSEMSSLYDMFNDMYGEPVNRKKENERAIGLTPAPEAPKEQRTAQSQQSGREFSTVRRFTAREPKKLDDRDSDALAYVAGRVPLHLRLETFDTFDGRDWTHSPHREGLRSQVSLTINKLGEKPWLAVHRPTESAALSQAENHVVKIIRLATNRIPTPAHLAGAHIDKLDQLDFYGWTNDDILFMPVRERIPPLQVIHIRSQSLDTERLAGGECHSAATNQHAYLEMPDTPKRGGITRLARQWAADFPSGYPQVAAVIARLCSEPFTFDSTATVPEDCDDVASHFLFHSHRGPDYLFATSAAMLLRSLGYPTRVATGLYANDRRYNRLSQQTAVLPDDVHFWAEVCLDGHTWVTVEPTPGYEVLPPNHPWTETAAIAAARAVNWLQKHPVTVFLAVLVTVLVIAFRRQLANLAYTLVWLVCQCHSLRGRVLATVWLIERRAALVGRSRPEHVTLASWYSPLARAASHQHVEALPHLLSAAARYLYAPSDLALVSKSSSERLDAACREIAGTLSLHALRQISSASITGDDNRPIPYHCK